jgi:hypothetical protein
MQRSATALARAALIACVGCGRSDNRTTQQQPEATGTSGNAAQQQTTFEGCLQKGAGMFGTDYLLTMFNEPPGVAGTSGSITATGSSVEREQMTMAAKTYRLDPNDEHVKLGDMVGKRIRVTGVIAERARVPNGTGPIGSSLDTQLPNRNRNVQDSYGSAVDSGDLAKIDVASAAVIGPACGTQSRVLSGRTNPDMAGTFQGAYTPLERRR